MALSDKDAAFFFELETSLHKREIRRSPQATSALLAEGFVEFGSSGRIWNKSSIVESMLRGEQDREIIVAHFVAQQLAPEVVLVTYTSRASTDHQTTLRSSLWTSIDGKWQLFFHQGTPSPRDDER